MFFILFILQLEDGHTLFDYNVGLNDIVQLLIRSQSEGSSNSSKKKEGESKVQLNSTNKKLRVSTPSVQPSTSARAFLIDPGIGIYKVGPDVTQSYFVCLGFFLIFAFEVLYVFIIHCVICFLFEHIF